MPRLSNHLHRIMLGVILAAGCLALGPAEAEDAVVLASTVPGYAPGMIIAPFDRISVPDGASATLLFQSGAMLRLGGPFEGTLSQSGSQPRSDSGVAMIAEMFRMQGADATVVGGTRSTGLTHSAPVLEDVGVDPQRSGTYCVETTTSVWISRPTGGVDAYALRRKGSSRTLVWPPGATRIEWPADVLIEDGSQYELATHGTALATVTFHAIPAAASLPALIAEGLILGCRDQFALLLQHLGRSVAKPEVWITTDRGRRPTYHAGEPISLTVMANMDAYLYCVAGGVDGSVRPIFPAGALDGAQLHGSVPLLIPGRRQPVTLIASPDLAQVRCWLADRDIAPELPHALLGSPSARLPDQVAGDLDGLFARVGGTRMETAVLNIRTE